MPNNRLWTRDELILTLSVYFQLPFGRLNRTTPEVKELARILGRTENSAALRLVNFAACDPYIINSGRTGMPGGIPICKPVWDEFVDDKERLFIEAQRIKALMLHKSVEETLNITNGDLEGKERTVVIKQRVNQSVFRSMILNNYEERCAITGINIPELLVAGHIIPWAESNSQQKLNPENGICLSALYDKAFDKGLITISPDDYTIQLSSALHEFETQEYYDKHFGCINGKMISMPIEHKPNKDFLAYHRDQVFKK
ncbi:MAG: HNH endonuclease [Bacteroidaceae bacterium]|nr:HNH endonuclease [Bacteroidaceae bacterium]